MPFFSAQVFLPIFFFFLLFSIEMKRNVCFAQLFTIMCKLGLEHICIFFLLIYVFFFSSVWNEKYFFCPPFY
eukprot:UN05960